jgi:hypothetical protein
MMAGNTPTIAAHELIGPLAHSLGADEPNYRRISRDGASVARILKLHSLKVAQVRIAEELGCHQSTVSRILADYKDSTAELAQHAFKVNALDIALGVLDTAKNEDNADTRLKAQKVALSAAGVIQSGQQVTVNNAVLIAQPDKPETWGPGPSFIEAKVVEHSANTGEDNT